jgi:hypothetical protein
MQQIYRHQSSSKPALPEHHTVLRIGEGILVIMLFAILILVLFP